MLDNQTTTFENYLNYEKGAPKNEFIAGHLRVLPDIDDTYFAIRMNLAFLLNEHFSKHPCEVHVGESKLYIEAANACLYPDILVACEGEAEQQALYKTQANLLVEVLNTTNGGYKRGDKLACYRRSTQVSEILLVNAEKPGLEYLQRQDDHWLLRDIRVEQTLHLPGVEFQCAVEEIYQDVFE